MNQKLFVSVIIAIFAIFSFTICFATTDNDNGSALGNATNGVRNFVGGVENTVENAAMGISNTSRNMTGDAENTMGGNNSNNSENNNGNNNNTSTFMGMGTTGDNGGYTATRTATDDTTVMGMSSTAWTWLILGITAIGIIAIVWYYSMQFSNTNRHNND